MAQANPEYRYYKQLAGTWKTFDDACVVTLTDTVGITVSYGGASFEGYYGVNPVNPLMVPNPTGPMSMNLMGFAGMPGFSGAHGSMGSGGDMGGMTYQRHPDEDIQLKIGNSFLKNGDETVYNINSAWHDTSDKLHLELANMKTGEIINLTLDRESVSVPEEPLKEGECRCECGQVYSSKFCPNCGKQRPSDPSTYTCSCGFNGPISKFCPNCGAPCPVCVPGVDYNAFPPEPEAPKAANGLSEAEINAKLEHGWRDGRGQFQIRFKDQQFATRYIVTALNPTGMEMPTGEKYCIRSNYSPTFGADLTTAWPDPSSLKSHPDELFAVYPVQHFYMNSSGWKIFGIEKIWYGSGTLHLDLLKWKDKTQFTVDLELDENVSIPEDEVATEAGWTCSECGATFQTGETCAECGAKIETEVLFALSEYKSTNPPQYNNTKVYKFSDTQLILQTGNHYRFIPSTVIEPALEIIRQYHIDKWDEYQSRMTGLMGGSQSVYYYDGAAMVGTSTDHNLEVGAAYSALLHLFAGAKCEE